MIVVDRTLNWMLNDGTWPNCGKCKVTILPRATPEYRNGNAFWCPSCKGIFGTKQPALDAANLRKALGVTWDARLLPDGVVQFQCSPGEMSGAQAKHMGEALQWLARASEQRKAHLRGADRWLFRRDGEAFFARYRDEEIRVERYDSRKRSHCEACRGDIPAGVPLYRTTGQSRFVGGVIPFRIGVRWRDARLCCPCVETAQVAAARGPLRVIDGGTG